MNRNKRWVWALLAVLCFAAFQDSRAQDRLPLSLSSARRVKRSPSLPERSGKRDTIALSRVRMPQTFIGMGRNEIMDSLALLAPVLERLRLVKAGISEDTVRVLHIGDSHIRGHLYPQATGAKLIETFGLVSYIDMGVNGATCLTFTHPDRVAAIAALNPELLILSFGTNESHNRGYNAQIHYQQMDELIALLRDSLPDVPMLLTTPPGSYDSLRQRRRRRTYVINPRTATAAKTIHRYAAAHRLVVWDLYEVAGGSQRACQNWQAAKLMRPDHVHYMPEGYLLQGELLYEAFIKAYNSYVSY